MLQKLCETDKLVVYATVSDGFTFPVSHLAAFHRSEAKKEKPGSVLLTKTLGTSVSLVQLWEQRSNKIVG